MAEQKSQIHARLEALYQEIASQVKTFIGYPCTSIFDYEPLFRFLHYPINNVGDPFAPTTFRLTTKSIEREVLAWFAELTHALPGDYWGYVTNGGSEGNLYGLYLAREIHPEGICYYSEETHYSVSKNLGLLKIPHIMIRSQPNGEIDYEDLRETIRIHRDRTPIILANIGTTMKEAIDDITEIKAILKEMAIHNHYIHCDSAFSGMTLPFIEDARPWDFASGIDSLSISGHKFIGSPIPCGIVLAQRKHVDRIARNIEYIGSLDTTITGSRNGITPVILWYAIETLGKSGFVARVRQCREMAQYSVEKLQAIGQNGWRNPYGLTVIFDRPPESILTKWQIAVKDHIAHIICLPHVTKAMIDEFTGDIEQAKKEDAPS